MNKYGFKQALLDHTMFYKMKGDSNLLGYLKHLAKIVFQYEDLGVSLDLYFLHHIVRCRLNSTW